MKETIYQIHNAPLNIALIADTHNHPHDAVLSSLRLHLPDIICIAGDFVYARLPEQGLKMEQSPHSLELLRECRRIAPTFVSLGNHEWMLNSRDKEIILSTGVTLLDNSFTTYQTNTQDIIIGGLSSAHYIAYQEYCAKVSSETGSDSERIYPLLRPKDSLIQTHEPDIQWLEDFCRQTGYKILLCHHPEYYPKYLRSSNIDLILSGHAHGGQVRILGQGLYAPGQGLFPALTSGIVDNRLVISRGLANNTIVPRVFNPEEIVYIMMILPRF